MLHTHRWSDWAPYQGWIILDAVTKEEQTYVDTWFRMCLAFPCTAAFLRDMDGQFLPGQLEASE